MSRQRELGECLINLVQVLVSVGVWMGRPQGKGHKRKESIVLRLGFVLKLSSLDEEKGENLQTSWE